MITTGNLQNQSKAELAAIAKRLGIVADGLSKEDLVKAISKQSKKKSVATPATAKNSAGKSESPKVGAKAATASKAAATSKSAKPTKAAPGAKSTASQSPVGKNRAATKDAPAKSPNSKQSLAKTPSASKSSSKPAAATGAKPTVAKNAGPKSIPSKPNSAAKLESAKPSPEKSSGSKSKSSATSTSTKNPIASKSIETKVVASKIAPVKDSSKGLTAKPAKTAVDEHSKSAPAKATEVRKPVVEKKKEAVSTTSPKVLKKIREMQLQKESTKDISFRQRMIKPPGATDPIYDKEPQKDRIAIFVRDPYWLHATWDITRNAIERAQAALAEQWYGAKPVLRLIRIEDSQATSVSETVQTEIDIRGGVRNWYIPWTGESANFRVSVGYVGSGGRYHVIALSNIVHTPAASSSDAVDQHWSDLGPEGERIFAMSGGYDSERETGELQEVLEDRLARSLGAPTLARLGAAADAIYSRRGGFHFDMDVELVVYGSTSPDAYLTLNEEPVALRPDGTFVKRLPFPDRRQVIPAVAVARDGSHQRTIVVGVERNTKIMEPMEQEQDLGE